MPIVGTPSVPPAAISIREYLIVSGVGFGGPAFYGTDLSDLRRPADQRGSDRIIPHGGVIAKPRRRTVTKRSLPLVIFGDVNRDGTAQADWALGVQSHIDYIKANVVAPVSTGDGTRAATLVLAIGNKSANVHVESLEIGRRAGPTAWAVLHLSLPGGEFV